MIQIIESCFLNINSKIEQFNHNSNNVDLKLFDDDIDEVIKSSIKLGVIYVCNLHNIDWYITYVYIKFNIVYVKLFTSYYKANPYRLAFSHFLK